MTYPGGWTGRAGAPPLEPGRCPRCGWGHPTGHPVCLRCGTALPRLRWAAHPPVSATPPASPPARRGRYRGPPGYGPFPPRWGFPAVVWRAESEPVVPVPPVRRLRLAITLAVVTAAFAVVAAGAETWRFVLLLAGRTRVLSGEVVRIDDALVTSAGLILLVAAVATAVAAGPALVRLHAAAARRAGRAPSRRPVEVAGWLLVPGANLWGAGMIVGEIDGHLTGLGPGGLGSGGPGSSGDAARPRPSRLVLTWWAAWMLNGALVVATLARGLGGSVQAVADTVELHIAVDLSAALVAGLGAAVLARFVRALTPARVRRSEWRVAPPAPTRPAVPPRATGTVAGPEPVPAGAPLGAAAGGGSSALGTPGTG